MSIESSIEQQIQEAIKRGDFDNLPGAGKPLDLTSYFDTPEDMRMAFAMLKGNNFVPEEVEIMREVSRLKHEISVCTDDTERLSLTRGLNEKTLALTLLLENRKKR